MEDISDVGDSVTYKESDEYPLCLDYEVADTFLADPILTNFDGPERFTRDVIYTPWFWLEIYYVGPPTFGNVS